jgi:alanine dehydrogenase
MKIVLLRERKNPPDSRVALTPIQCRDLQRQFAGLDICYEPSPDRCYTDEEYLQAGIKPGNPEDADILLGVKEVPVDYLIPQKTYLFFSHTIKEQPHNREMFRNILHKKIRLIDYECLSWPDGGRILGFGHWAGIVGAYNALLVWGKKFNEYQLKPAWQCHDFEALKLELKKIKLGPLKIAFTGEGRVAHGILELLKLAGIREIHPQDLASSLPDPVFAQFDYSRLYEHRHGLPFNKKHFYQHHAEYRCLFSKYFCDTDILINGMYWEKDMDILFQVEDTTQADFNIKVIADISCDIEGSVPIMLKDTKIADPVFGYDPKNRNICPAYTSNCIDIMAVSNLPAELPRNASETFGEMLSKDVFPLLIQDPTPDIIREATITENGEIHSPYRYLSHYGNNVTE